MEGNHRKVAQVKADNEIAVIPYVCYDALMERFEHTQKSLRISNIVSVALAVWIVIMLIIG